MDRGALLRVRHWLLHWIQTMTAQDIALYVGQLVAAWSLGFTGGYLLTKFRHAVNQVV